MKLCIIGGGSLGHVISAVAASKGIPVRILTRRPAAWGKEIVATDPDGKTYAGPLAGVSANPEEVLPLSDTLLLCVPGYLIAEELRRIKPYAEGRRIGCVVASTGFFLSALQILGFEASLFAFQRVPFIARVHEYGHRANLLGYKTRLAMALHNLPDTFMGEWASLLSTPVDRLGNILEATLTNSNPILHPSRLYDLFLDKDFFETEPLFYEEWTDRASEVLIDCDTEFQQILARLPMHPIPPLTQYYEVQDAPSMTRKLRSIKAFQGIKTPMTAVPGGFVPNLESRYFTEDIPFSLAIVAQFARLTAVEAPTIRTVLNWAQSKLGQDNPAEQFSDEVILRLIGYCTP